MNKKNAFFVTVQLPKKTVKEMDNRSTNATHAEDNL
jgi:hypothetical protein